MTNYLTYLAVAFFCSYLLIFPFQRAALYYEITSEGNKNFISRNKPTPLLGGGALYFGFVVTLLIFFYLKTTNTEIDISLQQNKLLGFLIGAALITFAGLIEDIYPYSKLIRCSFQIIASFALIMVGITSNIYFLDIIPFRLGGQSLFLGNVMLTVLWVILLINTLQIVDVLDGQVVGIAIVISVMLFITSIFNHNYNNALILSVFTGVLMGIFSDQSMPSKILLGKMGVNFAGFVLAAFTLDSTYSSHNTVGIFVPLLLIIVPLLYTILALLTKSENDRVKENTLKLIKSGIKENQLVFYGILVTSLYSLIAICIVYSTVTIAILLLVLSCGIAAFILWKCNSLVNG